MRMIPYNCIIEGRRSCIPMHTDLQFAERLGLLQDAASERNPMPSASWCFALALIAALHTGGAGVGGGGGVAAQADHISRKGSNYGRGDQKGGPPRRKKQSWTSLLGGGDDDAPRKPCAASRRRRRVTHIRALTAAATPSAQQVQAAKAGVDGDAGRRVRHHGARLLFVWELLVLRGIMRPACAPVSPRRAPICVFWA